MLKETPTEATETRTRFWMTGSLELPRHLNAKHNLCRLEAYFKKIKQCKICCLRIVRVHLTVSKMYKGYVNITLQYNSSGNKFVIYGLFFSHSALR
jgi:hypothetical protein